MEDERAIAMALIDQLPEPTFRVDWGEDNYTGEFWDNEPHGDVGARITYNYVEREPRYPIDHPEDVEWLDETIAVETGDSLNWEDDPGRRHAAEVLLRHYLSRPPTGEELDAFVLEVASRWEDGKEWYVEVDDIRERTGLWPEIETP